jgi:hypothetical protein
MKVRAIENHPGMITAGREYEAHIDGEFYVITDDRGRERQDFYKYRFAVVEDAAAMILPSDPTERKGMPITTGVLDYFPLALAEVAKVSKTGNDQHNPGQPLHWDKTKSLDHADCIPRHLIDRGARDTDGMRHSAKLAWRALALLQTELENEAKQ